MATGTKANNVNGFQTGKYSGNMAHSLSKDAEITPDLHLKMCKKIAQLTKVIYALNTKSDESDTIVANVKRLHEEQLNKIFHESQAKLERYRQRVNELVEEARKHNNTNAAEDEYSAKLASALAEIRSQYDEREKQREAEFTERLATATRDAGNVREKLETKLAEMDALRERWSAEKETAVTELEERYRQRLESVAQSQDDQQRRLQATRQSLEEKYQSEIASLQKRLDQSNEAKSRQQEEFDAKLAKAQAFFDKELEAVKQAKNMSNEEKYKHLEEKFETLRRTFGVQEQDLKRRIDDLSKQLLVGQEININLTDERDRLKADLQQRETEVTDLIRQLADLTSIKSRLELQISQLESDVTSLRQILDQQTSELVNKSSAVVELEAARLHHVSTIEDLRKELTAVKQRAADLETFKQNLESNQRTTHDEQTRKIHELQTTCDGLRVDNKSLREKHELELKSVEQRNMETVNQLQQSHSSTISDLKRQSEQELLTSQQVADNELRKIRQDLETEKLTECEKLQSEKLSVETELTKVSQNFTEKLAAANSEIERLESLLRDSQQGLGSAATHLDSLRQTVDKLNQELVAVRGQLSTVTGQHSSLQTDYNKLLSVHEASLKEAELRLTTELQKLTKQLDDKWKDILRCECDKLRVSLAKQKDSENQLTLNQLTAMKDAELTAVKQGWERKVNELLQEISDLKQKLNLAEVQSSGTVQQMKRDHETELQRLREEMFVAAQEYSQKVQQLESLNRDEVETLKSRHAQLLKEKEAEFNDSSVAERRTQLMAHKAAVDSLRRELETGKTEELESMRNQCEQDMDSLRSELELRFAEELEQTTYGHTQQLHAAKMELERALELSRQKDSEHSMAVSDLEEQVAYRDKLLSELRVERNNLQKGLAEMAKELEVKIKEILHVRSDANRNLREKEMELERKREFDLANAESDYLQKTQEMLMEFSHTQQMLKDKIGQLQNLLEEAEDRYRNRAARDEDVELIQQLKTMLHEQENSMKQLVEEKRYFQMELVNRETNFNKVFNSDPKVGFLNPLATNKKPKGKEPTPTSRYSSSSSGSSRLEPLAGSPMHDERLNGLKPIPPTKRIVK